MFRHALLAFCCCSYLISCQEQMQSVLYALETTQNVPEETPATLSVGYVLFGLQLLPDQGGVRVTSFYHAISPPDIRKENPVGTFVLKDNAYGVESQLRAVMAQGYKPWDAEHGKVAVQGEVPYIAYDINGKSVFVSIDRFGSWDDRETLLHKLNNACFEANHRELSVKK